jgi:hypothetical protein
MVLGILFFSLSSSTLFAQEHSFGREDLEHNIHHESNTVHAAESDHSAGKNIHADSMSVYRPVISRQKPKQSEARNHEEDALKFNFLYIIIQKFKFSDIID